MKMMQMKMYLDLQTQDMLKFDHNNYTFQFPPLADLMRFKSGPPSGKKNGLRGFLAPKQVAKEEDEKGAEEPRPTVEAAPNHVVSPEIAASKVYINVLEFAFGDSESSRLVSQHLHHSTTKAVSLSIISSLHEAATVIYRYAYQNSRCLVACRRARWTRAERPRARAVARTTPRRIKTRKAPILRPPSWTWSRR